MNFELGTSCNLAPVGDRSSSLEESHIPIANNTSNYEYRNTL